VAAALAGGALVRPLQQRPLSLAPDHRRVEAACATLCSGLDREQPVRLDRLALALELQGGDGLDFDCVAHEVVGRRPEQDLVRRRSLLEALGDVDGVACREPLAAAARISRHDLARVHARSDGDGDSPVALELLVQSGEALAHLGGGPDRADSIVLVHDGDPEDGHYRVADELLDRALVRLDDGLHLVEVAAHHPAQRFRVEALAESR
jgi:hypothetical protein